jgi:hypothetical protein
MVGLCVTHEEAKLLQVVQQLDHAQRKHELLSNVQGGLPHRVPAPQKLLNMDGR